jgi:hypothetical protein
MINMSPFFAMYGYHPITDFYIGDNVPDGEAPAALQRIERL